MINFQSHKKKEFPNKKKEFTQNPKKKEFPNKKKEFPNEKKEIPNKKKEFSNKKKEKKKKIISFFPFFGVFSISKENCKSVFLTQRQYTFQPTS